MRKDQQKYILCVCVYIYIYIYTYIYIWSVNKFFSVSGKTLRITFMVYDTDGKCVNQVGLRVKCMKIQPNNFLNACRTSMSMCCPVWTPAPSEEETPEKSHTGLARQNGGCQ